MDEKQLFPTSDEDLLISVYQKQGRTLDDLPYTAEFEALYAALYGCEESAQHHSHQPSQAEVFHRLHNLRKAGKLPRLGRAQGERPRITTDQEALLTKLVEQQIGEISKRDTLLYTPEFELIAALFNSRAGLNLDRHAIWRLIAKLAK